MGNIDLHAKPFDEGTLAKLDIFEDYAKAWIPTFVAAKGVSTICIFDFFAGTGLDINGNAGSAIRILEQLQIFIGLIAQNKVKVIIHLNEFDAKKYNQLKKVCSEYLEKHPDVKRLIKIKTYNKDFSELFQTLLPQIKQYPSLVYLDQNGVRFLSKEYLLQLEQLKTTDFLYFVSSSYFLRFGDQDEFKKHLDIDLTEARKNPYRFIHRYLIRALRQIIPVNSSLILHPYSLKKGKNIYGIIFGASHALAVDKFLSVAWKRDEINGEANFDIEDENAKKQGDLFAGHALSKIDRFKESVKKKILSGDITNNFELYDYTLREGHICKHAAACLREMKKNGETTYKGVSPLITYENVYKKKRKITYRVPTHEKI